jgi:hypothetical protein
MTVPAITLTATLQDLSGNDVGSAASPAALRISLCGYQNEIPRIIGTSVLARVGPIFVETTSGSISIPVWGNDVIVPAGTFYDIALLDQDGNVVQSGLYELTGSGTKDLSTLPPIVPIVTEPPFAGMQDYSFVASSTGTTFNLPGVPAAGTLVLVWLRTLKVYQPNVGVSGNQITIPTYYSGDEIDVVYWTVA